MKSSVLAAAVGAVLLAAPASAQSLVDNWTIPQMSALVAELGGEVTETGTNDKGNLYLYAVDDSELNFEIHGAECSVANGDTQCKGAQLTAWFELDSDAEVRDAVDLVDYAAVSDDNWGDGVFALTRYVILDGGITRENLRINLEVFLDISNNVWDFLSDEGFF